MGQILDLTRIIPHLYGPLVSPYTIYGPSNGGITTLDLTWIIPHLYEPLVSPYTIYGPSNGGITILNFTWISPISIDHWLILVLEIVLYMAHLMMDSNQILHCNICTHLYSDKRAEFFLNNWSQYTLISSLRTISPQQKNFLLSSVTTFVYIWSLFLSIVEMFCRAHIGGRRNRLVAAHFALY
jgi:hypothetical protein